MGRQRPGTFKIPYKISSFDHYYDDGYETKEQALTALAEVAEPGRLFVVQEEGHKVLYVYQGENQEPMQVGSSSDFIAPLEPLRTYKKGQFLLWDNKVWKAKVDNTPIPVEPGVEEIKQYLEVKPDLQLDFVTVGQVTEDYGSTTGKLDSIRWYNNPNEYGSYIAGSAIHHYPLDLENDWEQYILYRGSLAERITSPLEFQDNYLLSISYPIPIFTYQVDPNEPSFYDTHETLQLFYDDSKRLLNISIANYHQHYLDWNVPDTNEIKTYLLNGFVDNLLRMMGYYRSPGTTIESYNLPTTPEGIVGMMIEEMIKAEGITFEEFLQTIPYSIEDFYKVGYLSATIGMVETLSARYILKYIEVPLTSNMIQILEEALEHYDYDSNPYDLERSETPFNILKHYLEYDKLPPEPDTPEYYAIEAWVDIVNGNLPNQGSSNNIPVSVAEEQLERLQWLLVGASTAYEEKNRYFIREWVTRDSRDIILKFEDLLFDYEFTQGYDTPVVDPTVYRPIGPIDSSGIEDINTYITELQDLFQNITIATRDFQIYLTNPNDHNLTPEALQNIETCIEYSQDFLEKLTRREGYNTYRVTNYELNNLGDWEKLYDVNEPPKPTPPQDLSDVHYVDGTKENKPLKGIHYILPTDEDYYVETFNQETDTSHTEYRKSYMEEAIATTYSRYNEEYETYIEDYINVYNGERYHYTWSLDQNGQYSVVNTTKGFVTTSEYTHLDSSSPSKPVLRNLVITTTPTTFLITTKEQTTPMGALQYTSTTGLRLFGNNFDIKIPDENYFIATYNSDVLTKGWFKHIPDKSIDALFNWNMVMDESGNIAKSRRGIPVERVFEDNVPTIAEMSSFSIGDVVVLKVGGVEKQRTIYLGRTALRWKGSLEEYQLLSAAQQTSFEIYDIY